MSIEFTCECGRQVRVKPELAGRKIRCPGCGNPLRVPAESDGDAPAAATQRMETQPEDAAEEPKKSGTRRTSKSGKSLPAGRSPKPAESAEVAPTRQRASGDGAKSRAAAQPVQEPRKKTEFGLSPLEDTNQAGGKKTFPCPGCGAGLYAGDILCISCGMDLSTGQWVLPEKVESMGSSMARLIGGLLVAVLAIGGGGYWFFGKYKNMNNAPANGGVGTAGNVATPADPAAAADAAVRHEFEPNAAGDLAALAAVVVQHKAAALAPLAALLGQADLSGEARLKAVKGIAILARKGYVADEALVALDAALGSKDESVRAAAQETLYLYAHPKGTGALDSEIAPLGQSLPAVEGVQPAPAAIQSLMKNAGDPQDPLFFSAVRMLIDCDAPNYVGNVVDVLRQHADNADLTAKSIQLLTRVTGRQFAKIEEWTAWWDQNVGGRPALWLTDALCAPEVADRKAVHARLVELTGNSAIQPPEGNDPEAWKPCAEQWRQWLAAPH